MREGELLALTPADIDFKNKTVRINKSFAHQHGQDIIQTPKTPKSNRTINIPDSLCEILKKHISHLYSSNQRIFFDLNKHTLSRHLKTAAAVAGVKPIRIHDLRHSHAALLIEMGFSPLIIQERLGHEDIKTTLGTYGHLYPSKGNEVAQELNEMILRSK